MNDLHKQSLVRKIAKSTMVAIMGVVAVFSIYFEEARISELKNESSLWAQLIAVMKDTNTGIIQVKVGESTIEKANAEAEKLFGYEAGEMSGLPVSELVADAYVEKHSKSYDNSMKSAVENTIKTRVVPVLCDGKKKDGTVIPCVIRLYIGNSGVIALVNLNAESKYLPIPKHWPLVPESKSQEDTSKNETNRK